MQYRVKQAMSDYLVPFLDYGEDSFVEKKSRFIGRVWKVETQEAAIACVQKTRETHRDATHNCFAYVIREGNYIRYSDDGEPQGTAGMPILDVLRRENITNVCCVVTRYFGGILLGTGGLVRAYTQGAQIALAAAGIAQMSCYSVLLIVCPYSLLGTVQAILPQHECETETIDYGADVTLTVSIPEGGEEALNTALCDASAGTVEAIAMESKFMGRKIR